MSPNIWKQHKPITFPQMFFQVQSEGQGEEDDAHEAWEDEQWEKEPVGEKDLYVLGCQGIG